MEPGISHLSGILNHHRDLLVSLPCDLEVDTIFLSLGGTGGGRDGVWTGLGGVFCLGRDRGGAVGNAAVGDFGGGVEIARSAPLSRNPGLLAFC